LSVDFDQRAEAIDFLADQRIEQIDLAQLIRRRSRQGAQGLYPIPGAAQKCKRTDEAIALALMMYPRSSISELTTFS